jgi:hypothetical protein
MTCPTSCSPVIDRRVRCRGGDLDLILALFGRILTESVFRRPIVAGAIRSNDALRIKTGGIKMNAISNWAIALALLSGTAYGQQPAGRGG